MAAGTYFTGFDHLIGETVSVLADGLEHDDVIVDEYGGITLDRSATEVVVGFKYTHKLKTTKIEAGGESGDLAAQGDIKRIHRCMLSLYKTAKCKCGPEEGETETLELTESLFTGDVLFDFPANPEEQGQVYVEGDEPLPLTILMIGMRGVTYQQ